MRSPRFGWSVQRLASEEEKRDRGSDTQLFMLPGEVTRAEWHQSFSLDEIYKFETPTTKKIPALNNNLKFFLSATLRLSVRPPI